MTVSKSMLRIVEETLPLIIFFAFIELATGGLLSSLVTDASLAPGLLIIVPGMLGLRGNISSALGARLCSGLHLGYISTKKISKGLTTNIKISIGLSLIMSFTLSILAWLVCSFTSTTCMPLISFILISLITALGSGMVLSFVTAGVAIFSCRHGLDPDNTTMPSSASIGDIVTIIFLILAVKFVLGLGL